MMNQIVLLTLGILCAVPASAAEVLIPSSSITNRAALPRRSAPVLSPEVHPSGEVTFRFQAPNATEVWLNGQWPEGRSMMTKGSNQVWSVTFPPIPPGVWEYSFQVDGVTLLDPLNPLIKPMRQPRTSILHLPGDPPALHDFQRVPHGTVRQHTYHSKALNRLREMAVYTPSGYDQNADARYPTLYLQHGSGDNQATWTAHGKAHWILDNLIAQGKAKPMLLVMMDGHAALPGPATMNNTEMFERDLFDDVLPFIESHYRVNPGAENRAIAGLSMGGGQSLTIGLNHIETFAWVGGFSASVPQPGAVESALNDPDTTNSKLKLLWIACGRDDFLLKRNEEFIATLKEKSIRHEWHLTDGSHAWPIWRIYLGELVPRLF